MSRKYFEFGDSPKPNRPGPRGSASTCQTPERSGLPFTRGTGPFMSTFPSGVRGALANGTCHCPCAEQQAAKSAIPNQRLRPCMLSIRLHARVPHSKPNHPVRGWLNGAPATPRFALLPGCRIPGAARILIMLAVSNSPGEPRGRNESVQPLSRLGRHRVAQFTDAFDPDDHFFARLQPPPRRPREAHTRRSPRRDHIARLQRHDLRKIFDQFRNLEDHFTRIGLLQEFAANFERDV